MRGSRAQWLVINVLLASGLSAIGWSVADPVGGATPLVSSPRSIGPTFHPSLSYPADSLARVAAAGDVFRSDRRPAAIAYDPVRGAAPPPDAAPKPALVLSGIVWDAAPGAAPEAVIEGLPGIEGPRVMRVGDIVAGLTIRRIDPTRVVIVGMDTSWTLMMREPWR